MSETANHGRLVGMKQIRLRMATPADVSALLALQAQCFAPEWHDSEEETIGHIARAFVIVASDDDEIVGSAMAMTRGKEVLLYSVEVLPSHRGIGVGTLLVEGILACYKGKAFFAHEATPEGGKLLARFPQIRKEPFLSLVTFTMPPRPWRKDWRSEAFLVFDTHMAIIATAEANGPDTSFSQALKKARDKRPEALFWKNITSACSPPLEWFRWSDKERDDWLSSQASELGDLIR